MIAQYVVLNDAFNFSKYLNFLRPEKTNYLFLHADHGMLKAKKEFDGARFYMPLIKANVYEIL
jgi:hypothetical protein